jgi:CelD/BcsL family acetyltransferase involved in cellulose biosynthesis
VRRGNGLGAVYDINRALSQRRVAVRAATDARAEVLEGGVEIVERLAGEWMGLCAEGPCDEPFYRPDWVAAHVRAFESGRRLVVVTARVDGRLRGVLPLVRERGHLHGLPVRRLRGAVNSHSCRFDLVHGIGDAAQAARAVWQALRERAGWDVIELRDVPCEGAVPLVLAAARGDDHLTGTWERAPMPYLTLPARGADPDDALAHLSQRHRRMLRTNRRRLAELGTVRVSRTERPRQHELERFYALEASGWKGEQGRPITCRPQTRRFYDEVARLPGLRSSVTIWTLECGGDTVAMQYGVTYGGTYFGLKAAFDERYARLSPGHLLVEDVVHDAHARGLAIFDFMGESDDLKSRWCPGEQRFATYYLFPRGPVGHGLHAWKFRVLARARGLKRRRSS